jgi:hypothetical protein
VKLEEVQLALALALPPPLLLLPLLLHRLVSCAPLQGGV